jgi:hypothetical protein
MWGGVEVGLVGRGSKCGYSKLPFIPQFWRGAAVCTACQGLAWGVVGCTALGAADCTAQPGRVAARIPRVAAVWCPLQVLRLTWPGPLHQQDKAAVSFFIHLRSVLCCDQPPLARATAGATAGVNTHAHGITHLGWRLG